MKNIGAYILAGGKSSRMGEDKGLVLLKGKPMVEHVITALHQVFSEVRIVSNNRYYEQFGLKVLADLIPDKGPMGGIYTGLKDSPNAMNFFISCDMPFVSKKSLELLLDQAEVDQITVSIINDRFQPLFAVYPKSILPELEVLMNQNLLKLKLMIEALTYHQVLLNNEGEDLKKEFKNINTKAELDELVLELN